MRRHIPIMFSAQMIQALLAGRKTMTRRRAWREPRVNIGSKDETKPSHWQRAKPGDRLWVRESFYLSGSTLGGYMAERDLRHPKPKVISSLFMPRHLSRLTLIVTATKIERLQDISEADALAEGVPGEILNEDTGERKPFGPVALMNFGALWSKLHGAESWSESPEVVAITFRVVKQNIDALREEAA